MDRDELLRLLDLKPGGAGSREEPAPVVSEPLPSPAAASPSALELDDWGLRRGRDLLEQSDRLRALGLDELATADCLAAAFDPDPRLALNCRDPVRHAFFCALLDTPEYVALHSTTRLDPIASEIAALHFAEQLVRLPEELQAGGADSDVEVAALRAAGRAAKAADADVCESRDAARALGLGPGEPGSNDAKAIATLFRRVRSDPALARICMLAGRFRRLAQSRQRRKVHHGLDDVVGIEAGRDLSRVLPHELAKLNVPELEVDVLRRLVEGELMCREHHATEPVARGPVVVCADESGSMAGDPVHTAKALALALAWLARRQRRWTALVAYSGDSGERLLTLPPGRWDEHALADWLTAFIGGGSTLDVPVRELPRMWRELKAPAGDTDVVFITDCRCRITADVADAFLAWKQSAKARLITLAVGGDPGDLEGLSDEVHRVQSLDVTDAGVQSVLSL